MNMSHLLVAAACAFAVLESSAAICGGCKARSNPGARYCANCGKKMPAPETLEEKYEALMREAMPTFLAAQMTPEADVGFKTEEAVRSEMAKFRGMNPARQKQELEKVQKTLPQLLASLRTADGASRAKNDAACRQWALDGRNLFVAITSSNTEREAAGLASAWPQSADSLGADKDDISGMLFKTSTDYFRELFDMKNVNTGDWAPYVAGVDWQIAIPKGASQARWIVARGVPDDMADIVPVLVSSNVDPASLVSAPGKHNGSQLKGELRFSGEWAVIVRKGGAVVSIKKPSGASLSDIYKNEDFVLPKGFGYLKP